MFQTIVRKVIGSKYERELKRLRPLVEKINCLEKEMSELSDTGLKGKTAEFKERINQGAGLDDILPEAFAVVRETSVRTLKMRHFDVQLMGGAVLHEGKIAEMKTGEGKTLVSTLPSYLNALTGKGVHIITVNDYLAKRDSEWMGQIHNFLGLEVGLIQNSMDDTDRKRAYGHDITYGTNNEFGFDYLRDNMKFSLEDYVQRDHHFGIVDEVDSILIDEARTPLIISGPADVPTDLYHKINRIIPSVVSDENNFTLDEKARSVSLSEEGVEKVEDMLRVDNLYDASQIELLHHVQQALKAHTLFKRDVDYVVKNGEVIIVDEFTGRLMPGRRFSEGLHQALEAKEHVRIEKENQTLATITFQNYFRMYDKLSGMTGTADTEATEFNSIYELDVIVLPTNKPMIRCDLPDLIYRTETEKYKAVADDIEGLVKVGKPILVGTISIENSEKLAHMLKRRGIKHHVLNAKHHEKEAEIVANAGQAATVTIATNMAGRGTDIVLGESVVAAEKKERFLQGYGQKYPDHWRKACLSYKEYENLVREVTEEKEISSENIWQHVNGLHIIGTERHESRRIDDQLRGRCARQGDPGTSRFYLSLEDDLLRIFGSERISSVMQKLGMEEGQPIEHNMITKAIENAQKKVEGHNFDIRKNLLEYDDVMNQQRTAIYNQRRTVLEGKGLREMILQMADDIIESIMEVCTPEKAHPSDWDFEGLEESVYHHFTFPLKRDESDFSQLNYQELREFLQQRIREVYPEAWILLHGPEATRVPEEYIGRDERIVVLRGEVERSM
ncbi:MAG: preprotein translocase subunit SecA, partial [bacterium]